MNSKKSPLPDDLSLLLVDDEANVVRSLARGLSLLNESWEVHVATSAKEGLDILNRRKIDVIVSDMRMPGVSGASFLAMAKNRFPETLRLILSGFSSEDLVMQATHVAHRYLDKPCASDSLVAAIKHVYLTQRLIGDERIEEACRFAVSSSLKDARFRELLRCMENPFASPEGLMNHYDLDPWLADRIASLAGALGIAPEDAASFEGCLMALGLVPFEYLALFLNFERLLDFTPEESRLVAGVLEHGLQTRLRLLSRQELHSEGRELQMMSAIAIVHDIGKLVFIKRFGLDYLTLWERSAYSADRQFWEVEKAAYGCDHAEAGAYLCGVWKLPEVVIRSLGWQHRPDAVSERPIVGPAELLDLANREAHRLADDYFFSSREARAKVEEESGYYFKLD